MQPLRMLAREIMALCKVLVGVVELPTVVFEVGARVVPRDGLPATVPERAIPEDLVILRGLEGRRVGRVEAIGEAHPMDRQLKDPAMDGRRLDAEHLEYGRHDIDDMVVLRADVPAVAKAPGPVHD